MKNILKILVTIFIFLCLCPVAFAMGNISDITNGEQDFLVLGTVVDIDDKYVLLEHYQTIRFRNGIEKTFTRNDNIKISKFRYSYCEDHSDISLTPRVGDNVFISLNRNGNTYTMVNGAYKISSVDYKMLTFYASESMKGNDCLADIVALAYFVRTNGTGRNFDFENGVLTTKLDDKVLTLYPTENITDMVTFLDLEGNIVDAAVTKDVIIQGENIFNSDSDDYRWIVACFVILLSCISGGVVIYKFNGSSLDKEAK